jgi:hypothetical protein
VIAEPGAGAARGSTVTPPTFLSAT